MLPTSCSELHGFEGKFATRFGASRCELGPLCCPYGLAMSGDESKIIVSDFTGDRIQLYRASDYSYYKTLSPPIRNPPRAYKISDIGVISSRLYGLDAKNHLLYVFNEPEYEPMRVWQVGDTVRDMALVHNLIFLAEFDAKQVVRVYSESGAQLLILLLQNSPHYGWLKICVSEENEELIVANAATKYVQHYTLDGKFLREWPIRAGLVPGTPTDWIRPYAIGENILLSCACSLRPRLLRCSFSGAILTDFGCSETFLCRGDICRQPEGIISADGLVYVADQSTNEDTKYSGVYVFK